MKTNDQISNALNMAIEPEIVDDVPSISEGNLPAIPDEVNVLFEGDFETVRKNITSAITSGKVTLAEMTSWASQAQNHFAYGALAAFLGNYIKANESLLNIHKVKRDIAPAKVQGNTNVLIVTTADLLRLMKQANNAA